MRNETNTKFAMKLCRVKCAISSSASADLLHMHVGCNIIKLAQHKVISFFFHQNREHENRCQKMHTSALNSHLNIRFHFSSFFCSRSLLFSAARCWLFRLWHWRASLLLVVVIHIIVEALENYNNGKLDLFVVRASRITFKWIILSSLLQTHSIVDRENFQLMLVIFSKYLSLAAVIVVLFDDVYHSLSASRKLVKVVSRWNVMCCVLWDWWGIWDMRNWLDTKYILRAEQLGFYQPHICRCLSLRHNKPATTTSCGERLQWRETEWIFCVF